MHIQDIRRSNLNRWVTENSVPPKEKSYFSQLMSGASSFGERSARRLERDYKMGDGFLDRADEKTEKSTLITISSGGESSQITISIPQYKGIGGAMGSGVLLRDQPGEIDAWSVTPEWIAKNVKSHSGQENLCIVTGFGDSMQPLYNPGDPLLVDTGVKTVEFDAIYFFRVGNEGFIKRLQRIPGEGLRVLSKNPDYVDWTIKADMDFEVLGRVLKVWCGSNF